VLAVLVLVAEAPAQQLEPLEPILFPILSKPFAGNFGTFWQAEAWMVIDTDAPLEIFPLVDCVFCVEGLPRHKAVRPPFFFQQPNHHPGSILYVTRGEAGNLAFSLRVREASRGDSTSIPVVRESELHRGTIHLLDVPFADGYRRTLRIYDIDARAVAAVSVRLYPLDGDTPLSTGVYGFTRSPAHNPNFRRPVTPGYIQLDLGELPEVERARVEIEPLTPDLLFWAFISVTSNATQQFTTIEPE
jgi:hypothetical protein